MTMIASEGERLSILRKSGEIERISTVKLRSPSSGLSSGMM